MDAETTAHDFVAVIFRELSIDEETLYFIFSGKKPDECILKLEFPAHSVEKGFNMITVRELIQILGWSFKIYNYSTGEVIEIRFQT